MEGGLVSVTGLETFVDSFGFTFLQRNLTPYNSAKAFTSAKAKKGKAGDDGD